MDTATKVNPRQWSGVEKCLLWLGLILVLCLFYLYRVDSLLTNVSAEPYFDRHALEILRLALVAFALTLTGLLLAAIAVRKTSPENAWILHGSNQVWWVWASFSAYSLGPLTTPILGLLLLGGFVSILLFPRRVAIPALCTGMLILFATTVAERAGLVPYAPVFAYLPGADGRLPTPYVVVTSVSGLAIIVCSFAVISYLVEGQRAEASLRENERRLREQFSELNHIYQNAPIGLALHDTELRYIRINERLAAINGAPVEAHIGRTVSEIVPEIAETVRPVMQSVLDSGEPVLDIEVRGATKAVPAADGFWLTSYYPLESPEGRILGVSAVVQDISELKRAEDRARRHLEQLAHVSRLTTMGQMATGIAHELTQPLATMTNYAFAGRQRIEGGMPADSIEIHKLFNELLGQSLRAGEIVQHLRAFVNKAPKDRVAIPVNSLIGDVLGLMEPEFRVHDVLPRLALDTESALVCVDAIQIQQVILNLIRNALEAMGEVNPSQRALVIASTCTADQIEVAVRDSGIGLSGEDPERAFAAFYTTKGDGMGMGLAISRSIIEAHGGQLWAGANPDGGMTFRFTLPGVENNGDGEV